MKKDMAFIQAASAHGSGNGTLLSADNPLPERHIVIDLLRKAMPVLGLSASVITTLDAMISCLPPKRNHHTVFASNATLAFRRNGISDRTIRRHVSDLQEAGLLERRDSPNKKRYTRHNTHEGKVLRFGFDLSPLFARLHEIASHAAKATEQQEKTDYLRCKIRAVAHAILEDDPENALAHTARKSLRRKLDHSDCADLLNALSAITPDTSFEAETTTPQTPPVAGNVGQNVRHHHNSNKEIIDNRKTQSPGTRTNLSIPELVEACPEAVQFSLGPIATNHDVIAHARTLAPMIGIDAASYEAGQRQIGPMSTAITVWAIMQFHDRIKSVGAYFRALTSGSKSKDFDPAKLIRRLATAQIVSP